MMALVSDLELPAFDCMDPSMRGERFHAAMSDLRRQGWLAQGPFGYMVLDRESADFFLRTRAVEEFYEYAESLVRVRRENPGDDLISKLIEAEEQGDRLSDVECVNLVFNVLVGGVDTSQSQLAHAIRLLAEHQEQWALLTEDPGGESGVDRFDITATDRRSASGRGRAADQILPLRV